jgi:hypoxanthine phosphoribosyltransferase
VNLSQEVFPQDTPSESPENQANVPVGRSRRGRGNKAAPSQSVPMDGQSEAAPTPASFSQTHDTLDGVLSRPAAPRSRYYKPSAPMATPIDHPLVPTTHRPFSHPSEDEFARILNFYGVQWLYEPRSFPLRWNGGRVVEMFTPDFYMPESDLYIELTTMKQSLVTDKNRKLREIKELYPDINIKLLYRRDIHRLLAKYGFGPLAQADIPGMERVLFTKPQIDLRVTELGRTISKDYVNQDLVLIGVLRGVFCFMADLMRQITLPLSVDFMSVSYYGGNQDGTSLAQINKGPDVAIAGRHVLLIEDIVDTGMTLGYLMRYLQAQGPASVKVCVLLDKQVRRLTDIKLDYVGFEAPDEFLVGYGLDYMERYRNMPFIGILLPEESREPRGGN